MARVGTYLNFKNNSEKVFNLYRKNFGTAFEAGTYLNRF